MAKDSLFSILSRAPWWLSIVIGAAIFAGIRLFLPDIAAFFAALPFLVIACYAGWRQMRAPSITDASDMLAKLRTLSWDGFAVVISAAFRYDGYSVTKIAEGEADFELRKSGRVSIVSYKRWKVAQTGIGPLRDLHAAMQAHDAQECIYVTAGDVTANASAFAKENSIRVLSGAELGGLVARFERSKRRWFLK
jgi:restriction system protein